MYLIPSIFSLLKRTFSAVNGPLSLYRKLVEKSNFTCDPHQLQTVQLLQDLHLKLLEYPEPPIQRLEHSKKHNYLHFWRHFDHISRIHVQSSNKSPLGLYLWGDVGTGKTFLMDLFYETLPIQRKKRIHFHAFMADIHKRVHSFRLEKNHDDPVPPIAKQLFHEAYVLCFDELQVTDIKDAMILRRLFEELIQSGCVMVTTSNRHPDDLYKNGIQRESFLPAITLLKKHLIVHPLNSGIDYRKQAKEKFTVFFHPLNSHTNHQINNIWRKLTLGKTVEPTRLKHLGRSLDLPATCGDYAKISFHELCCKPYAATDYMELAKTFSVLILTDIPKMNLTNRNEARRLITLIDTLYENKVKLIMSSDAPINYLFVATDSVMTEYISKDLAQDNGNSIFATDEEVFAFERTQSRLTEMQNEDWFGPDFKQFL